MRKTDPYLENPPETSLDASSDRDSNFIGPVVAESRLSRWSLNRLVFVPVLLLAVFGVWAISNIRQDREDQQRVAYVEQTLNPDDSLRRSEAPPLLGKPLGERAETPTGHPYDGEIASVDLAAPLDDNQGPANAVPAPSAANSTPVAELSPVDLDYSDHEMPVLSEAELKEALSALDSSLEKLEPLAERTEQKAGFLILEERFDRLDDLARVVSSPIPHEQLLDLTRQSMELRDEVEGFQSDLETIAATG